MSQKGGPFVLCLFDSLTLCLFVSQCRVAVYSLMYSLMYSLCIVCAANYTFRNARIISEIKSKMQGLCIVCRVFLFPPLFTYKNVQAKRAQNPT